MKKYVVIFFKFKKKLFDCENLSLFGETLRAKDPNETRGKPSITRRSNYWKRERERKKRETEIQLQTTQETNTETRTETSKNVTSVRN
jgi:hypothetical protein